MIPYARIALLPLTVFLVGACQSNPYFNPTKPHHRPDGFQNNYEREGHRSFFDLLSWKLSAWREGLPKEPEGGYHPEVEKPDLVLLREHRANPSVTWIGHATLMVQMGGSTILTDPQFSERASPFDSFGPKRRVPPALSLEELPHIDVVVISHNHYDHLDRKTVTRLAEQPGGPPRYFVPLGLKPWFEELGITTVTELDWWDEERHGDVRIVFTPLQHWSARTRFDANRSLWGGWLLESPDFRFFFAGDTGYSADFRDIRERLGPVDLAALPIGSYEPRWFMKVMHVNPEEAVRIHKDLEARYSVAIHWGTFDLTDESIDEPPRKLAEALDAAGIPRERFFLMRFGETRDMGRLLAKDRAQAVAMPAR
jgi:L-ascorbate metabolism protein UlaG (beta-lactamase superfamily)